MRNFRMLISGLAVVVAVGGAVCYLFPAQPANPAATDGTVPQGPSADTRVRVVPSGNLLLSASRAQLERWVPLYPVRCGEIVFGKGDAKSGNFQFCIDEIRRRFTHDTGTSISREDLLDADVRAHWREVTGVRSSPWQR